MSDRPAGPAGSAMRDVGERLRNAAEIDPSKLPGLVEIAESVAASAAEALAILCVRPAEVSFAGFDTGVAPETDGSELAEHLVMPITSKRFAKPAFASVPKEAIDLFVQAFFGASPAREGGPARAHTDLDKALAKMAVETVLTTLQEAFRPIDNPGLELGPIVEPETYSERFSGDGERFVVLGYEIKVGEMSQAIVIALPSAYLMLHRRALSIVPDGPEPSPDKEWSEAIGTSFGRSDLKLDAVLARKKVPLSTIARLREGQTLALDVAVTNLIAVECEGKPLFRSQVGFARDSYVVRFAERIDPAQEFLDDILAD